MQPNDLCDTIAIAFVDQYFDEKNQTKLTNKELKMALSATLLELLEAISIDDE